MVRISKVTRETAITRLADVPQDKKFYVNDGRALSNMYELAAALSEMSDETYIYHANKLKNDFARWVQDVIGDETLAKSLMRVSNRLQSAREVSNRISWLRNK